MTDTQLNTTTADTAYEPDIDRMMQLLADEYEPDIDLMVALMSPPADA
jgi:hypothetical protein